MVYGKRIIKFYEVLNSYTLLLGSSDIQSSGVVIPVRIHSPFSNVPSVTTLQPPKNSNTTFVVQSSVRIPYDENNYAYHFSKHVRVQPGDPMYDPTKTSEEQVFSKRKFYLDGVKDSGTVDDPPRGRRVHKYEVDEMITYLDGEIWEDGHYHDY